MDINSQSTSWSQQSQVFNDWPPPPSVLWERQRQAWSLTVCETWDTRLLPRYTHPDLPRELWVTYFPIWYCIRGSPSVLFDIGNFLPVSVYPYPPWLVSLYISWNDSNFLSSFDHNQRFYIKYMDAFNIVTSNYSKQVSFSGKLLVTETHCI